MTQPLSTSTMSPACIHGLQDARSTTAHVVKCNWSCPKNAGLRLPQLAAKLSLETQPWITLDAQAVVRNNYAVVKSKCILAERIAGPRSRHSCSYPNQILNVAAKYGATGFSRTANLLSIGFGHELFDRVNEIWRTFKIILSLASGMKWSRGDQRKHSIFGYTCSILAQHTRYSDCHRARHRSE